MPDETEAEKAAAAAVAAEAESESKATAGPALQSALDKERKARKEAEAEAKALRDAATAREQAELSDAERFRVENEQLKADAARHEAERKQTSRADMVRRAAKDFEDPEDVVALLRGRGELEDIDTDAEADAKVKALAKAKPHLLRQAGAPDLSGPGVTKVLHDGLNTNGQRTDIIPGDKLREMSREDLAVLKIRDPKLLERSMSALTGRDAAGNRLTA